MENNITLLNSLNATFYELEKVIRHFDKTTFNEKPVGKKWSPGMVVQHLILAGTGIDHLLVENTKASIAPADEKVAMIKGIFLNFNEKYNAPSFIIPADKSYQQAEQLEKLAAVGSAVAKLLPELDLSLICLGFEFPGIGHLSRLALISFLIYHTQRHTHQLNEMVNLFKDK